MYCESRMMAFSRTAFKVSNLSRLSCKDNYIKYGSAEEDEITRSERVKQWASIMLGNCFTMTWIRCLVIPFTSVSIFVRSIEDWDRTHPGTTFLPSVADIVITRNYEIDLDAHASPEDIMNTFPRLQRLIYLMEYCYQSRPIISDHVSGQKSWLNSTLHTLNLPSEWDEDPSESANEPYIPEMYFRTHRRPKYRVNHVKQFDLESGTGDACVGVRRNTSWTNEVEADCGDGFGPLMHIRFIVEMRWKAVERLREKWENVCLGGEEEVIEEGDDFDGEDDEEEAEEEYDLAQDGDMEYDYESEEVEDLEEALAVLEQSEYWERHSSREWDKTEFPLS